MSIEARFRIERAGFTLDVDVTLPGHGIAALFGPSGAGKTTLLRCIAGLDRACEGRLSVDGEVWQDETRFIPTHRRALGYVFQEANLFPHLTVRGNLEFGWRRVEPRRRQASFDHVVALLDLDRHLDALPDTLSGGERQRVAIGRALLASPRLLLMDEPLASLDAARKLEILPFIERLRDEFAIPIIYVSHSMEEIARLAATVVRLETGRVAAIGAPADVLLQTPSPTAGRFEAVSMITGHVARHLPEFGVTVLAHPAGEIVVPGRIAATEKPVGVAIRATNVTIAMARTRNISVRTLLAARVLRVESGDGAFARVTLELTGGDRLLAYVTRLAVADLGLDAGDEVFALVKAVAIDERGVPGLEPART